MLRPDYFLEILQNHGIDFFAGVPDSLLKYFCACLDAKIPKSNSIISANEGAAIALAAGYHLATNNIGVVYMQNSGMGNAINPLLSLLDKNVYKIPVLLIIGWRGEPGIVDEPQHKAQGFLTIPLLETLNIKYEVLNDMEDIAFYQVKEAVSYMKNTGMVFAFIVKRDSFASYPILSSRSIYEMTREKALEIVLNFINSDDIIISSTGMLSRELFEYREHKFQAHNHDFLTVGSMGHASQIALGIALQKKKRNIYCLDGDGSFIMHMGSAAVIGSIRPNNFRHIIFNNGVHDSVGGQPTAGFLVNITEIARACGYDYVYSACDIIALKEILKEIMDKKGAFFVEIKIAKGYRQDLGRPTINPEKNKAEFMNFLSYE